MDFKGLLAYQKGFELAMEIFYLSKSFPKEEKYSLTDQIRRSARSVCACIGESYRKRLYPAHFISKLSDSDMENSETQVWLDFAFECEYLKREEHEKLTEKVKEIGKLLNYMILNPEKFGSKRLK
jgi:four helix bundle protein